MEIGAVGTMELRITEENGSPAMQETRFHVRSTNTPASAGRNALWRRTRYSNPENCILTSTCNKHVLITYLVYYNYVHNWSQM